MTTKENHCTLALEAICGIYIGDCCRMHDIEYRARYKKMTRKEADLKFLKCLKSTLPWYLHFVAWIYYFAVRLFSGPSWERWKYNWIFGGWIPIKK